MDSFTVAARFCGPPESGNGGYTCGLLAAELGDVTECTLRAPVPLDVPLQFERTQAGAVLRHGGKILVEANPTTIAIAPPAPVTLQEAADVMAASPALALSSNGVPQHPFPTCFVCGPKRAVGDGLRIFPAPVDGGLHVAAWVPVREFGDCDQFVRPEFLWAAM